MALKRPERRTVRLTSEEAERLDDARGGVPFERWARGVLLDAAYDAEESPSVPLGSLLGEMAGAPSYHETVVRAPIVWGGCEEHPDEGAVESRGVWWCAHVGCAHRAVAR